MALADPQTVTVNAVAQVMPRVEIGKGNSTYRKSDGTYELFVSHQKQGNGRVRSTAKLTQTAIVPDPITAVNDEEKWSFQVIIDRPLAGFTSTQVDQLITGFKTWLTSTIVGNLYGLES